MKKILTNYFLQCLKVKFTYLDKNSFFVDRLLKFYCFIQLTVQIVLFLVEKTRFRMSKPVLKKAFVYKNENALFLCYFSTFHINRIEYHEKDKFKKQVFLLINKYHYIRQC